MVESESGSTAADTTAAGSEIDFVALPPGATIGRYEVLAVLGQGGFGITYRARDIQLGREVAIKEYLPVALAVRQNGATVLPRSTKATEDFIWGRDRFVAEGRVMATLHRAPGIVRVFDFIEINGTAYIVMELLHGDTLEGHVKKHGPMNAAAIDRIVWPLLEGLEQVHDAGFLHRDIKPANILLDAKGDPTLIDFGASRAAMVGRTVAMTAIFTPGYAAPEQFTSAKQGPWTDIYGVSATLYNAIAGVAPPSAFDRMLDDTCEPIARRAPPGFSPGLLAGIDAGLAVRATDRPQSIAGWRQILSLTVAPVDNDATMLVPRPRAPAPTPVSPPLPPAAPASSPENRTAVAPKNRLALYAGLAATLLVAAGGGYVVFAPASTPASKPAPPAGVALQDLKIEELERVLAERRKADFAAAEKRRLEEEAQRRAEADALSKKAADIELEKAQLQRQKAEEDLARLKAEMEERRQAEAGQRQQADSLARRAAEEAAQRKAEAEMAALRQAESDARRKAEAEAAAKQQADEALARAQAERQRADVEAAARRKTEQEAAAQTAAETAARRKADDAAKADVEARQKAEAELAANDRKAAETAETALRLAVSDRQHVQVALTSLGFDTRGTDGVFGPRSRETIASWQKARSLPPTGFLTGLQNQALLREAAPAIGKYDDEQKKIEEEKKKADEARRKTEEEARLKAAAAAPVPAVPVPATPAPAAAAPVATAPAPAGAASRWIGQAKCAQWPFTIALNVPVTNGQGSQSARNGPGNVTVAVSIAGNRYSGNYEWKLMGGGSGRTLLGSFSGTISGTAISVTTIVRSDIKGGGLNEDQCVLDLRGVSG